MADPPIFRIGEPELIRVPKLNQLAQMLSAVTSPAAVSSLELDCGDASATAPFDYDLDCGDVNGVLSPALDIDGGSA